MNSSSWFSSVRENLIAGVSVVVVDIMHSRAVQGLDLFRESELHEMNPSSWMATVKLYLHAQFVAKTVSLLFSGRSKFD